MAERGSTRKATYYYGARRRRDLCFEKELHALEEALPGFRYVPALSEPPTTNRGTARSASSRTWSSGARATSPTPTPTSAGPRRWSRRRWRLLTGLGTDEKRIYYDKFTTTGAAVTRAAKHPTQQPDESEADLT